MNTAKKYDITSEHCFRKFRNGIEFLPAKEFYKAEKSLDTLATLPFNFYLVSSESKLIMGNEKLAETCDTNSAKELVGKSSLDFCTKETSATILNNDQEVLQTQQVKFFEENAVTFKGSPVNTLSLKLPWYSKNRLIGITGFSISFNEKNTNFVKFLSLLSSLGLLNNNLVKKDIGIFIDNIYFSSNEAKILSLLVRGYSAKIIASRICLSPRTVENYIARIKLKTGIHNKAELIDKMLDLL